MLMLLLSVLLFRSHQKYKHSLTHSHFQMCILFSEKIRNGKGDRFYLLVICELWTYVFSHSQRLYPFLYTHWSERCIHLRHHLPLVRLLSVFSNKRVLQYTKHTFSWYLFEYFFAFITEFPLILLHYFISTHCSPFICLTLFSLFLLFTFDSDIRRQFIPIANHSLVTLYIDASNNNNWTG